MNKILKQILFIIFLSEAYFLQTKEVIVDSLEELILLLKQEKHEKTLIIIDLFDVGIEYNSSFLHQENKSRLIQCLKTKAQPYQIKLFLKEKEAEGLKELDIFFNFYETSENILLITDKSQYYPSKNHEKMQLNYDSYKKGVVFYKANFWIEIIILMLEKYDKIIFISSNKNKTKKFQANFKSNGYTILYKNTRKKLANLELENIFL